MELLWQVLEGEGLAHGNQAGNITAASMDPFWLRSHGGPPLMPPRTPGVHTHEEWKGMAQSVGLVVEPVVLNRLGVFPESATTVQADWTATARRLSGKKSARGRTELIRTLYRYLDDRIAAWLRQKYKRPQGRRLQSWRLLARIRSGHHDLFAHWRRASEVACARGEPYDARVSRTVLRAPRGAVPRGDSTGSLRAGDRWR